MVPGGPEEAGAYLTVLLMKTVLLNKSSSNLLKRKTILKAFPRLQKHP